MNNKVNTNDDYTNLWVNEFSFEDAMEYDAKWYTRFEKNIKHKQQIAFVAKHLKSDSAWCDCPIGSGRLMRELQTSKMVGFDRSPEFAALNRRRGIEVIEGDIRELPFRNEFEIITCLNMLFAFDNPDPIINKLMEGLKSDGILIVDLLNEAHVEITSGLATNFTTGKVFTERSIRDLFSEAGGEIIDIQRHDYWDNRKRIDRRGRESKIVSYAQRILNEVYFKFGLFPVFNALERRGSDSEFVKYLVAVRKK